MWNMGAPLPGTGSDKGNVKREIKPLGKLWRNQMYKPHTTQWLLSRINPTCENCNCNDHYLVNLSYIKPYGLPLGKLFKIFKLICPNCGETIELDIEEFLHIEPFIKINTLFESGKIDEFEYKYRLEKIEAKYRGI